MGILANSASVTHASSTSDDTKAGFVVGEEVTLTANPAFATYTWGIAKPAGATSRSDLSEDDVASPKFTPDTAGTWVLTATDGDDIYILRITATAVAITSVANAHRFSPVTDNSVPTPALGKTLYVSSDQSNALAYKDTAGTIYRLATASSSTAADPDMVVGVNDTDAWIKMSRTASDQPHAGLTLSDFTFQGVVDQVLWVGHNVGFGAREDATKPGMWLAQELKFLPSPGHQGLFEWFGTTTNASGTARRPLGYTVGHTDSLAEIGCNGQTTFLSDDGVTQYALVERTTGAIVSRGGTAPKFYAEGINRTVLAADKQGGGGAQAIVETVSNTQLRIGGAPSWTRTTFMGECHFAAECFFDGGVDVPQNQYVTAGANQLLGLDNFNEVVVGNTSQLMITQASNGGGHGVFWNIGGINATMRNEGWSLGNGSTVTRSGMLLDLVSTTRVGGVVSLTNAQMVAITPAAPGLAYDATNHKYCGYVFGATNAWVALH